MANKRLYVFKIRTAALLTALDTLWASGSVLGIAIPTGSELRIRANLSWQGQTHHMAAILIDLDQASVFDQKLPGGDNYQLLKVKTVLDGEDPWTTEVEPADVAIPLLGLDAPTIAP